MKTKQNIIQATIDLNLWVQTRPYYKLMGTISPFTCIYPQLSTEVHCYIGMFFDAINKHCGMNSVDIQIHLILEHITSILLENNINCISLGSEIYYREGNNYYHKKKTW